jgi:hypothetical protein
MTGSLYESSLYINTYTYIDYYICMRNNIRVKYDNPEPWGLFFQDNATPQMEALEELHNNIMFYLAIIMFSVTWIFISIILNYNRSSISHKYMNHGKYVPIHKCSKFYGELYAHIDNYVKTYIMLINLKQ